MPTTADEMLRDFKRFTGDGLPDEPVGAPLPIGDPTSGAHTPTKAELRTALSAGTDDIDNFTDNLIVTAVGGTVASASYDDVTNTMNFVLPAGPDGGSNGLPPLFGQAGSAIIVNATEDDFDFEPLLEIEEKAGNGGNLVALKSDESGYEHVDLPVLSGSRVLLRSDAMSDTLTFTGLMDPTLYIGYEIEYIATGQVSGGVAGELVVSSDNGATWDAGAADYSWIMTIPAAGSSGTVANGDDDSILFSSGISWGATAVVHHKISIMRPDLAQLTTVTMDLHKTEPGGGNTRLINSGFRDASTAIDAIELRGLDGSGTVTGVYYFYGIRA